MSASGLPSYGTSLPSNLDKYMLWVALPSASTPSPVNLIPPGVASTLSVRLLGARPGLYWDFAASSFHVPSQLSAARTTELERTKAQHAASDTMSRFLRISLLEVDDVVDDFGNRRAPAMHGGAYTSYLHQ